MTRKMQGRISRLVLVAAVAASVSACDMSSWGDNEDDSADFAQVCTDAAGNAEPDSDCDNAPGSFAGDDYDSSRPYMWRYYPASNLVVVPYGQRMPSGGVVRRPATVSAGSGGAGGTSRPAKIATPSAGSSGGTLSKSGSSSSISRGGFGVKGGGSSSGSAGGKGGSGS